MAARTDTHTEELDPRAREVLREIVVQYVSSGEPISSRSLAKCGRFQLSPATLRNVMADLEDLGYVYQPHTSAGRVPSDVGYRYFINHLMRSRRLSLHDREVIDDQVGHVTDLDEGMQLASRLLARLSDQVGVVFIPKLHNLVMRSMDFVSVGDRRLLCIIVGTNGVVVNKIVDTSRSFSRDELERISRYLSTELSGNTLEGVRTRLLGVLHEPRAIEDRTLRETVSLGMEAVEDVMPHEHEVYVEGAVSILNKPEFADAESMRKTFLLFEEKERLVDILNRCLTEDGLQILIGSESRFTQSYNFSLVATRYGTAASPLGLVGVIGPTRMEYERMAPLVDYLGRALTRKIEESKQEPTRE